MARRGSTPRPARRPAAGLLAGVVVRRDTTARTVDVTIDAFANAQLPFEDAIVGQFDMPAVGDTAWVQTDHHGDLIVLNWKAAA